MHSESDNIVLKYLVGKSEYKVLFGILLIKLETKRNPVDYLIKRLNIKEYWNTKMSVLPVTKMRWNCICFMRVIKPNDLTAPLFIRLIFRTQWEIIRLAGFSIFNISKLKFIILTFIWECTQKRKSYDRCSFFYTQFAT